jgi:hypothetical protein
VTLPVLGSSRVIGLAGAYSAITTGIDGASYNPASFASRTLYEVEWLEWGISLGVGSPGTLSTIDLFNNGQGVGADNVVFGDLGLRLQLGPVGAGVSARTQVLTVADTETHLWNLDAGAGYQLLDGQLVVGVGARIAGMDLDGDDTLVQFVGAGLTAGAIVRLADRPWRLGVAAKTPVRAAASAGNEVTVVDGVEQSEGFVLPDEVRLPWELQVGFAWQLGDRPLNHSWTRANVRAAELKRNMKRQWCERMLAQLRREQPDRRWPSECARLEAQPANEAWWAAERERRRRDRAVLDDRLDQLAEAVDDLRAERYEALSRDYWLISFDVRLIGAVDDAVGIDGFVEQVRRRSGRHATASVHLGVETEPWHHRLKVRFGSYVEPARNEAGTIRPHGTLGFDLRLFTWDLFGLVSPFSIQLTGVGDVAPRYFDVGLGIGFWH